MIDLRLLVASVRQVLLIVYVLYCGLLKTDWFVVACNWIDLVDVVIDLRFFWSFSRALEMFDCVVAEQFRDNKTVPRVLSVINI